jgi:phosphatidate cytidylyltransferase
LPSEPSFGPFRWDAPVLIALLPLWAGDSAAIFAGKAFGKHPLAPSISPKKTWEGGIANFLACVLTAYGVGQWIGLPVPHSLAIGASTGILGQVGDLFESWLKRKAGVKDSGTILPGHGGFLDRLDSLLFTAIPAVLITMHGLSR